MLLSRRDWAAKVLLTSDLELLQTAGLDALVGGPPYCRTALPNKSAMHCMWPIRRPATAVPRSACRLRVCPSTVVCHSFELPLRLTGICISSERQQTLTPNQGAPARWQPATAV